MTVSILCYVYVCMIEVRSLIPHDQPPIRALCMTIGETASLKNACRQYGLTEKQVRRANLPCQYRSFHGNPYMVVKLSDMAALKATLQKQAKEAAKQKLIDELGEHGYAKKMAELKAAKMKEKADLKAAKEKEQKADKLSSLLFDALAAVSKGGISPTLTGATITKTAAKKEWRVKPEEIVGHLKPVDPTKKHPKYYLADVIEVAHNKGVNTFSAELESSLDRRNLYARYLVDVFHAQCKAYEAVGDSDIVQKVGREASGSIEKALGEYEQLVTRYQEHVFKEKERITNLDRLLKDAV